MFRFNLLTRLSIVSFLVIAPLIGCNETSLPTAPPPPASPQPTTPTSGEIYGVVTSTRDGLCLGGATVEMIDGPRAGERVQQSAAVCADFYDMYVYAFIFKDLPLDQTITLRASMPGYQSRTMAARVIPGCCFHHSRLSVEIGLDPLP